VVGAAIARAPWLDPAPARAVRVFTLPPSPPADSWGDEPRARGGGASGFALGRTAQGALPLRTRAPAPGGPPPALRDAPMDEPFAGSFAAPRPDDGAIAPGDGAVAGQTRGTFFRTLGYIGQLDRTYLVCEGEGELILIDQHAAHERVAFARLQGAHGRSEIRRQRLLFPLPVEIEDLSAAALSADGRLLEALGFEVELGPERAGEGTGGAAARTILVRAVPEMLKDADPKPLLRDVLGQLADGGTAASAGDPIDVRVDHALATMACHSVVRAGDTLGRQEVLGLLAQLDDVDLRSHCPHGRPVLLRMPLGEIERRFGRTCWEARVKP
jgi:DNA mismatch repair protein MutL